MSENRRGILEMLAAGKITADEAERLIAAMEKERKGGTAGENGEAQSPQKAKYLRVMVQATEDSAAENPVKVNVRVPMQLLRAGVKLTSLVSAQAIVRLNDAMRQQGVDFDLAQLKPENLEELIDQLNDLTVDVDQKDTHVRVFCE